MWLNDGDDALHVRASSTPETSARCFDLWRIPGRKQLAGTADALLSVSVGPWHARILLDGALPDGAPFICTVPLTPRLRGQLLRWQALARLLQGVLPPASAVLPASRSALLHLRALQALDAMQWGASHRDLAIALFGLEAVRTGWHADSTLRAQVRHLVARARGLMRGGYLDLAGLRSGDAAAPGDETAR